jgi:PAS domain S-box-containing protein
MPPQRESNLLRQLGALFRFSAQVLAGLDDEHDSLIASAREHTPAQHQRQYLEAALQTSPVAIAMLDLDGRLTACNPAFEKLFGYTQAEIAGHNVDDLILPEMAYAEAAAYTHQALVGLVHAVTQRRRKDGMLVEVELFGVPVRVGDEPLGAVVLYEDVTERVRLEAWLRLANRALEAAANAIVICDRQGRIMWTNPAFTHLTGYTIDEAHGQTLRLLKSGKHDQAFYRDLWNTILAGQVWQAETINRRKDGSLYVEDQTIAPVRDERGEITHFISIKQDITNRKRRKKRRRKPKTPLEPPAERSQRQGQAGQHPNWRMIVTMAG